MTGEGDTGEGDTGEGDTWVSLSKQHIADLCYSTQTMQNSRVCHWVLLQEFDEATV